MNTAWGKKAKGDSIPSCTCHITRFHRCLPLGLSQRMLELAIARAKDRVTFGKSLIQRQAVQADAGRYGFTQVHTASAGT